MDKVFIYWDNSNIHISAQEVAAEREGGAARRGTECVLIFAICWNWRGVAGQLNTLSLWDLFPPNCGTYGTGWKTKA